MSYLRHLAESLARQREGRSPRWPEVRHAFLKDHASCAACGETRLLQVHHVDPFHLDPARELDPTNLIALCMGPNECHLKIGHGDDWRALNPTVRDDATLALAHPDQLSAAQAHALATRALTD